MVVLTYHASYMGGINRRLQVQIRSGKKTMSPYLEK
jgi:hypothetical protein